jgi:hypothetical protein
MLVLFGAKPSVLQTIATKRSRLDRLDGIGLRRLNPSAARACLMMRWPKQ